jgi:zinc/manganese transport system substrate-binding protein
MKIGGWIACWVVFCALSVAGAEPLRVSTFSTVLTEIATEVGGAAVKVHGHVGPGVDPHGFEPRLGDLRVLERADVVLLSAKGLEAGYARKLREAAGRKALFVEVGAGFPSLRLPDDRRPGGTVEDPHWWHSIAQMRRATRMVRDALIGLRPAERASCEANADRYLRELERLEGWVRSRISALPRSDRKLVTSHDAFQYFAKDYGFTIYAIEGVSASDEPSSAKVAGIIATIRAQGVKAVFPEQMENPRVLRGIVRESGAKLGGVLYADGLAEGMTYSGMFRHNVTELVEALQ